MCHLGHLRHSRSIQLEVARYFFRVGTPLAPYWNSFGYSLVITYRVICCIRRWSLWRRPGTGIDLEIEVLGPGQDSHQSTQSSHKWSITSNLSRTDTCLFYAVSTFWALVRLGEVTVARNSSGKCRTETLIFSQVYCRESLSWDFGWPCSASSSWNDGCLPPSPLALAQPSCSTASLPPFHFTLFFFFF